MKSVVIFLIAILNLLTANAQVNKFQEISNHYCSDKNFSGVVLIATNGKVDHLYACGIANRKSQTKITPDSKFRIASMTKVFTAVLIMKLYQDHKIQLDETIGKYYPAYNGDGKDKVTIHQLLTYSSGIENQAEPLGMQSYQGKKSIDEYITQYCSGKLINKPGEKSVYSNTEYIILTKIIENITHEKYKDYLQEVILTPLKMKNTGVVDSGKFPDGLVDSYTYDTTANAFSTESMYYAENFFGSGNMYSTAEDMLAFNNAIFSATILPQNITGKMLEINEKLGYTAYGLWGSNGWGTFSEKFYYRTGGILGSASNWINTMGSKKTIIVLSNTDAANLYEMSEQLYKAGIDKK